MLGEARREYRRAVGEDPLTTAPIAAVGKMIEVSQSPELPALYSALAAHYLFEYIDADNACHAPVLAKTAAQVQFLDKTHAEV